MVSLLLSAALAGNDPCAGDRRIMVVFPTQVADGAIPDEAAETAALIADIADGLMAVDYPLRRFDTRLAGIAPRIEGEAIVGAGDRAVRRLASCADLAIVPVLTAIAHTASGPRHKVSLTLALAVYERSEGRLALADTLVASAPNLVDTVEDAMSAARRSTLDRVKRALPVSKKKLKTATDALDIAVASLPEAQSRAARAAIDQGGLAVTRVASAARAPRIVPAVGRAVDRPASGLAWRSVENDCYLRPPKDDDPDASERNLQCAALNRVRQAVRAVQLDTRRRYKLGTPALVDSGQIIAPLGEGEGVARGDGFRIVSGGQRVGYARVRRVGAGGVGGWSEPSQLQPVYGRALPAEVSIEENPQLGIEIGGQGGIVPARRAAQALPADPLTGAPRTLGAGGYAASGTLRFDVHLGRPTGWYEWYQTNRIEIGFAGPLSQQGAHFGLERRMLIVRRLYALGGASGGASTFSVPSGATKIDDDGDERELRANATALFAQAELGLVVFLSPSLTIRTSGAVRIGPNVRELRWRHDDREGTVALADPIRTTGAAVGLSAAWVF